MRPLGAGGTQGPRGPAPRAAEQVRVCCWTGASASPQGALAEASGTTVRAAACHSPERAEVTEGPGSQPWLVTDAMGVCVGGGGRPTKQQLPGLPVLSGSRLGPAAAACILHVIV